MTHNCVQLQDVPLEMVVAMDANGGIGKDGRLPWPKNTKDFQHFKKLTEGHHVIMGRKTFDEIEELNNKRANPCKTLLSNRTCHVLTRSENIFSKSTILVEPNLRAAVQSFNPSENLKYFIIGGLELYKEALPWITTIHATIFNEEYDCDRFLPLKTLCRDFNIVAGKQEDELTFVTLQRIRR